MPRENWPPLEVSSVDHGQLDDRSNLPRTPFYPGGNEPTSSPLIAGFSLTLNDLKQPTPEDTGPRDLSPKAQ